MNNTRIEPIEMPASDPNTAVADAISQSCAAAGNSVDPTVESKSATVTARPGSAAWIQTQIRKAPVCLLSGWWIVVCPVCGDVLQAHYSRPRSAVAASLRRHMGVRVFGLKYLNRKPGDLITVQGEKCEVIEGPYRPIRQHHFQIASPHTFFVVIRRLRDGRILETSCRVPNKLEEHYTKSGAVRRRR